MLTYPLLMQGGGKVYEISSCKVARYARQRSNFLEIASKILNLGPIEEVLEQELGKKVDVAGVLCYPMLSMFKVLLLQMWFNLSDRGIDEALLDRQSFRSFAGFGSNDNTPTYSTICRFRNKLVKLRILDKLFALVVKSLSLNGLINNKGLIVDSAIVSSSRRYKKTLDISSIIPTISYSEDKDARWTIKSGRPYYGYKIHMSVDVRHGFITGGFITGANCSDAKEFTKILNKSILKPRGVVLADKGYSSQANRHYLNQRGIRDWIMHKATSQKKLTQIQKYINSQISKVRSMVERAFGTLKQKYQLHRAKYLGVDKIKGHFLLAAIAFNIKKAFTFVN